MTGLRLGPLAEAAGYRLSAFDIVGSTNTEAMNAVQAGDPGLHWFASTEQNAGRGRRGRTWFTNRGNLAASLLLIPEVDPAIAATLGFVAGIALHRALAKIAPGPQIALKWPNDVLIDGAKLCGILLEARRLADGRTAIVVGIGVNVVSTAPDLPYPATSLSQYDASLNAASVLGALSDAWVECYDLWANGEGIADVLAVWRGCAAGIGAPVAINRDGDVITGIFETIDNSGRLIVRSDDDTMVAITAGDVHFGATASIRA